MNKTSEMLRIEVEYELLSLFLNLRDVVSLPVLAINPILEKSANIQNKT